MDKKLKETKKYYYSHYYNEETSQRIKKGVLDRIINKKTKNSFGKKAMYYTTAAIMVIGLFIGSGFVSPTMANVLAQIPILNSLFEKDTSLNSLIVEDLQSLDYNVGGTFLDIREKTIGIGIKGSESYYNEVKDEVEAEIKEILHARGLDAYKVVVSQDIDKEYKDPLSEEQRKEVDKYIQQSKDLEHAILSELKKQDYEILSAHVRINKIEKFIPLEIPVSETRVEEMKRMVEDIVKEKGLGEFQIKTYKIDPVKEEAEGRWRPVISTITEGLIGIEKYKVTGVGYSFYPSPLTISIRTSIKTSDSKADELVQEIEQTIHEFIQSDEVKDNVKDDPYIINIYGKGKTKIN